MDSEKIDDKTNTDTKKHIHHHRSLSKNEFKIRPSRLDLATSENSLNQSEFRGFFNLIVLALAMFFLTTETKHLIFEGTLIGLQSLKSIFERFDLFPAWIALLLSSFSTFFLQKCLVKFNFPRSTSNFVHYSTLAIVFFSSVRLIYAVNWPLVQTVFFLVEMLVLEMKMQSYYVSNQELTEQSTDRVPNANGSPQEMEIEKDGDKNVPIVENNPTNDDNQKKLRYPQNVTLYNYIDFLLIPTLCYEIEYPRTPKIRISYLLEKIASFVGIWAVLHVITELYIIPILRQTPHLSPIWAIVHLIFPAMMGYLLLFYIVFEVICNGFAEVTRFADREFYSDWWNSTTFDEFARKWNKPVHEWLLRHVYLEGVKTYKMSKRNATLITFLFSSIVHEFFMWTVLRVYKPWLFFLQMLQLPLIFVGRWMKGKRIGNYFFWFSMMFGPPILSILYCREFMIEQETA